MSRPASKAPVLPARGVPELIEETREFEFLTPMFGGGTRVREFDPITPVRVPSIRGQLRFWWRAANPRGLSTLEELSKAEAEVFGNTSRRSRLIVRVIRQPSAPEAIDVFEDFLKDDRWRTKELLGADASYGAFPLRGERDRAGVVVKPHGQLHAFGGFTLQFCYPRDVQRDVDAAIWAWSTFGGLGGRTRRGFGAVHLTVASPALGIEEGFREYVQCAADSWSLWPRLKRFDIGSTLYSSGPAAHQSLLRVLRELRQGPDSGRRARHDRPTPGRSYWPEPDAIRRITGDRATDHHIPVTKVDAFPRAAFGLPIVFHFKDRGDPPDRHLLPLSGDRWASPLVFRPVRADSGSYRGIAAELVPRPHAARLKDPKQNRASSPEVAVRLSEASAREMPVPQRTEPDAFLLRFIDPIEAFFRRIP